MADASYLLGRADAGCLPLPDKSIHCCLTSPPYFGLRDYKVKGQVGLEETPQQYVERLVGIFREVRRVLRDDGVLLLNIGDSYANKGVGPRNNERWPKQARNDHIPPRTTRQKGISSKNRLGIPHRVIFALQDDGWVWRDEIVWEKPNPMPESVSDRTTRAHEFVFVLTKSGKYYWDAEAIKEESKLAGVSRKYGTAKKSERAIGVMPSGNEHPDADPVVVADKKNARSVWKITPSPYKGAHFACMPPALAERCILAGSSENGVCDACGAPYKRKITKTRLYRERPNSLTKRTGEDGTGNYCRNDVAGVATETVGWVPTCKCGAGVVPATILDNFVGSGTTVMVANRLGRNGVGFDLNAEYLDLARKRVAEDRIKRGVDIDPVKYPLLVELERRRETA